MFVQEDGSLLLSGEGSGMTNESLTGEVLPPLPSTVDEITITWEADTEVYLVVEGNNWIFVVN